MSAKSTDLARVQEVFDVVRQTQEQMRKLVFTRERFLNPTNGVDDLIAEGLMSRAFRITEEAGKISTDVAARYGFDTRGASGVHNRLATRIWKLIARLFGRCCARTATHCLWRAGRIAMIWEWIWNRAPLRPLWQQGCPNGGWGTLVDGR